MAGQTVNRGARYAVAGTALGAIGASLVAAAASLCCVGPAVIAVLGASGAVAAAGFAPYRPYLLVFAFALLGSGFWRSYRPRVIEGATCAPAVGRWGRLTLWISLSVTLLAALLPFFVPMLEVNQ
jgi:mercuric ion transport protein